MLIKRATLREYARNPARYCHCLGGVSQPAETRVMTRCAELLNPYLIEHHGHGPAGDVPQNEAIRVRYPETRAVKQPDSSLKTATKFADPVSIDFSNGCPPRDFGD